MHKGYLSEDILIQCKRLDQAGIHYHFFYLTGISGAGRGRESARATAEICNQLHPLIIGASMLTIYPTSELYKEIQKGTWQEETELEKYQELKTLIQNLQIPVWFGALGASNPIPLQGTLPKDKTKVLSLLDQILKTTSEEDLQTYRKNLKHL